MKRIISLLIVMAICFMPAFTFAAERNNSVCLNTSDYDSLDEMKNDVYKLLSSPEIDEVVVFTEEQSGNDFAQLRENNTLEISPNITSPVYYQVKNVVKISR